MVDTADAAETITETAEEHHPDPGANSFRNAMVLSKRQNGLKSAKIDEETMAILLAARDKRPTRSSKAFTKAEVGRAERKKSGFPY